MSKRDKRSNRAAIEPQSSSRAVRQGLMSLLIFLNFASLVVVLSANLAPSFLQGRMLAWLAPWHVATGQDYTLLPLELTQGAAIEEPLFVEFQCEGDRQWRRVLLPSETATHEGQSSSNSRWPNLSRLLVWISNQQPDSEVLAEFCVQAVRWVQDDKRRFNLPSDPVAIRLFKPHVRSFDEDLLIGDGKEPFMEAILEDQVVYEADILRPSAETIRLVPRQEAIRTSKPIAATGLGANSP